MAKYDQINYYRWLLDGIGFVLHIDDGNSLVRTFWGHIDSNSSKLPHQDVGHNTTQIVGLIILKIDIVLA